MPSPGVFYTPQRMRLENYWTFFAYHSIVNTLNIDNFIDYIFRCAILLTEITDSKFSLQRHAPVWIGIQQVNEEKGDRKFGGCPSVHPSARCAGKYVGNCKTNTA